VPDILPPACYAHRVAVIGAGKVGSTLAQRLAERGIAHVVLLDVIEGLPQGIALDLMQARGLQAHDRDIIGTNDYKDTANADVVVITAGRPRTPGIDRDELVKTNAEIIVEASKKAIEYSPNAFFIIVTNPLDAMTYLAWETTQLPRDRIVGMAGVLDSARLQAFIAMELGVPFRDVRATVIGNHGKAMVPLPKYCTVNGIPLTDLLDRATIDRLVERTRNGGTEIVNLMKRGGAYFAPASAACNMVEAAIRDRHCWLPGSVYLQGRYGIDDLFLGTLCRLGCRGVEDIMELQLTDSEAEQMQAAATLVRETIARAKQLLNL